MTTAAANAAIDRMESDDLFASRVKDAGSPDSALEILRAEGFEVTQQDMRDAALDRFGEAISPEQLDQVAGGLAITEDDVLAVMTGVGFGALVAVAAASL